MSVCDGQTQGTWWQTSRPLWSVTPRWRGSHPPLQLPLPPAECRTTCTRHGLEEGKPAMGAGHTTPVPSAPLLPSLPADLTTSLDMGASTYPLSRGTSESRRSIPPSQTLGSRGGKHVPYPKGTSEPQLVPQVRCVQRFLRPKAWPCPPTVLRAWGEVGTASRKLAMGPHETKPAGLEAHSYWAGAMPAPPQGLARGGGAQQWCLFLAHRKLAGL